MAQLEFKLETPCYIISEDSFERNLSVVKTAFEEAWNGAVVLGYSIKTNHYPWLLKKAQALSCWAEAVSGDEIRLALRHGHTLKESIFNGPQKSIEDILNVLKCGGIVNLDNFSDVDAVCERAAEIPKDARIGLRVNFDLEKICPKETTAGSDVSRFGICVENGDLSLAMERIHAAGLAVSGLHLHYSSKTRSVRIFKTLAAQAAELVSSCSLGNELRYIDIGGGFFGGQVNPNYPTMGEYAEVICTELKKAMEPKRVMLIVEPGASVLSTCVEYASRVINKRTIRDSEVLTMDGSILHINPFMASRKPVTRWNRGDGERATSAIQVICGCTCMEKDRFDVLYDEPSIHVGDQMTVSYAGAYTMGFNSCFINLPPRVYLKTKDGWELLSEPVETLASMI